MSGSGGGGGADVRLQGEERCPSCGALVTADAAWCGQCLEPLRRDDAAASTVPAPEAAPHGSSTTAPARQVAPAVDPPSPVAVGWPCPVCGEQNPISFDACAVCGTSFATAMHVGEGAERPTVTPKDALAWSLVFPGLGHQRLGFGADGFARGVIFVVCFGMALLIGLGGALTGALFGVFALYLTVALVVYAGSAYEAFRMAEGAKPFVPARLLLWALAALILASVVLLALSVVGTSRR